MMGYCMQLHKDEGMAEQAARALPEVLPLNAYDGVAELWTQSLEALLSIFSDAEFQVAGGMDLDKYANLSAAVGMLGRDTCLLGKHSS